MDLRTIMNSDAAPHPPRQSPSQPSAPEPFYHRPQQHVSSSPGSGYPSLPPQPPPPLRPLPAHPSPQRSSSYGSIQSPYQYNFAPTLSAGAQSQQGPSSPHVPTTTLPSGSRDLHYSQQQHAGPPLASPYVPQTMSAGIQYQDQPSYFSLQRSHSVHSVPTPTSTSSSHLIHHKESPQSAVSQQSFHWQQFPPQARRSISSGAPLGPPSAPYLQPSPHSSRPQSSGEDSHHNQVSNSLSGQDNRFQDRRNTMSPSAKRSLTQHDVKQVEQTPGHHLTGTEREATTSVSPRTVFTSASRQGSVAENVERSPRNYQEEMSWKGSPEGSTATASHAAHAAFHANAASSPRTAPSNDVSTGGPENFVPQKMETNSMPRRDHVLRPPKRKKIRYSEPPVFARKTDRTSGRCPVIPNPHPPIPKHARTHVRSMHQDALSSPIKSSVPSVAPAKNFQAEAVAPTNNHLNDSQPLVNHQQEGPIGSWEPSITGFIPHEEITKLVCDFLFQHVVIREDAAAGSAGTAAVSQGAIVEVEAKLGKIIDLDQGDRLHLPVLTESVFNRAEPRFRTSFESSMSLEQHRTMNNFLNEAVKASMPHSNPGRTPISYAHKKERDTFYEVSPYQLPPIIRQNLNPRHKPKIRVTTDQRTDEVLAKIVKCRVADIDVYSPRTCVDWRISVNLEMEYSGDVRGLTVVDGAKGRGRDRNKDRMSYRHQAYQIDLTQVAKAESQTRPEFDHELEIEVSAAEIRNRGHLAMAGDPNNQYEDLIRGFVDNIRVLARTVPP